MDKRVFRGRIKRVDVFCTLTVEIQGGENIWLLRVPFCFAASHFAVTAAGRDPQRRGSCCGIEPPVCRASARAAIACAVVTDKKRTGSKPSIGFP